MRKSISLSDILSPSKKKNNGLREGELEFIEEVIRGLIRYYSREAGVRGLEREIAKICRKIVKENVVSSQDSDGKISLESLEVSRGA